MAEIIVKNNKKAKIRKDMFGLFFEDINYAADGGLYSEMIENYNFEALMCQGDRGNYKTTYDGLYGWEAYPYEGSGAMLETLSEGGVSINNPHYLSFTSSIEQLGFSNKAYDGIYLEEGKEYNISLYMRRKLGYTGKVEAVIDYFGEVVQTVLLDDEVDLSDEENWKKIQVTFKAEEDVFAGTFAICLDGIGRVEFDFISLKPADAVCGIFRKDLAECLKELKPGFMRFPGGCIVEGNTLSNRYKWKDSVGELIERKNNWNRWAVHNNNEENGFMSEYAWYNQTLGLGYYEYFILCEYLECEPLPVANVGLACQFMSTEMVPFDSLELNEYIQDVLDLIEFANGDVSTKWGSLRAKMGHPESFKLKYVGIGNEQWETKEVRFFERYERFEKAIHEKYPEILLISSAGPDVNGDCYKDAWNYYNEKKKTYGSDIEKFVYAIDEHYYKNPQWMLDNVHFYDDYSRDIKVFAGEYATHIVPAVFNNPSANSLYAALTEAAFMTGILKNADVVALASYAPLFARMGYTQWSPDLIWFDGRISYKTPSYYVQQMYSVYKGDYVVDMEFPENIYGVSSITEDEKKLYIMLCNVMDEDVEIDLSLDSFETFDSIEEIKLTSENRDDYNSLEEPEKIKLDKSIISGIEKYNLTKNSFVVLCMERN